MILMFENMTLWEKVKCLLRKFDLFIQTYDLFKENYLFALEQIRTDHTYARRNDFFDAVGVPLMLW